MIPLEEIEFEFDKSSGPGGQNVNKRETKVHAQWLVANSKAFNEEQKSLILQKNFNNISHLGYLQSYSQETRSQEKNKELAIEKLNQMVDEALIPEVKRIPTKVPRRVDEARIHAKRYTAKKKSLRRIKNDLIDQE